MLLTLGIALHLALAGVVAIATEDVPCTQQCPDDDSSGQCPPTCPACVCCHHLSVFDLATEVKVIPAPVVVELTVLRQVAPRAPAPAELLRPPIIHLA